MKDKIQKNENINEKLDQLRDQLIELKKEKSITDTYIAEELKCSRLTVNLYINERRNGSSIYFASALNRFLKDNGKKGVNF